MLLLGNGLKQVVALAEVELGKGGRGGGKEGEAREGEGGSGGQGKVPPGGSRRRRPMRPKRAQASTPRTATDFSSRSLFTRHTLYSPAWGAITANFVVFTFSELN